MTMMKSKFSNSVKIISRSSSEGSDMEDLINCQSDLERTASHSYSSSSPSFRRGGGGTKGRIILTLFICTSLMLGTGNGLRINSHGGYEDLVVSIGNDVPPIACQQLIQNLQLIFTSASEYLNTATKGRAYFHRVHIILPAAWDYRACGKMLPNSYTSASSIRDSQFRIGGEHPVFGHNPWTQQSKGCGQQGDMISAGFQYVLQYNDTEAGHSTPERTFVKEFVKFRYGVFEETGFENDPIYPTAYYHGTGSKDERKPTSCTNRPLTGNWSGTCNPSGANCAFVPFLNGNDNITSSIMSNPHLPHVTTFCDSTNHNRQAPTKQNFLCDHKSISEIINSHPDFHNISLPRSGRATPEFVIKQLTQPRFVLMVEETGNMNLRDVWRFLKLAVRKLIKYDLPTGTQIGLMTVSSDIRILANMTVLDDNVRAILAEKLPNYPNIESGSGTLSLRKGISQSINMLKWNGGRVGGSVIILISQGTISPLDLEASVHLLKMEDVALATIEYPSIGDGKISALSQATNSPHFAIRETGVGTVSHMSTYIQLVNSLMSIQNLYCGNLVKKRVLIHQAEFKGDAPSVVESQFNFDAAQVPAEFHVYIPSSIDPKVNRVELTSPAGTKFSDHTSTLHDINVMKMGVLIDQPGIWRYRIERLGDSHQSHFVQVVTNTLATNMAHEEVTVRVFSNVDDEARGANLSQMPLILYASVKRGLSPVIDAEVECLIVAGTHKWSIKLWDNGNGDPDLTKDDGIYSRYIIPPPSVQSSVLEITVKVLSSPYKTKYIGTDNSIGGHTSYRRKQQTVETCCGSRLISSDSPALKTMAYTERVSFYSVKVSNARNSEIYPPSRIGDLRLVDSYDTTVTLSFTAPGDDYDHKTVDMYQVFYRRSFDSVAVLKEQVLSQDIPAGSEVNMTIRLPSHGIFYLSIVAIDPYKVKGKSSNTVQVKAEPPPPETNTGSSESQIDIEAKKNSEGKLTSTDIALIIVGVIAFFILLAVIIVVCVYCRRRNSKGMGSTDTHISTISDTSKAPIHWSASQLLSEHEKRQSMTYAPSSHSGGVPASQQGSYGQNVHHHHVGGGIGHFNGSPGSSTRSFRSISDNARKTSVDYESCSSDPTIRSAKGGGPTDYETPIESDQENYRTIDSYSGIPPYRLVNGIPHHNYNIPRGSAASHPAVPAVNSSNSSSHMQYNPNIQGSLTSVNSKARRNITMV
ncbi:calcium-activated chloride channel regulator 2 [Folsomia candida]|uniref:calcium-activated chloride channel regulator 2 n=1 Tax=Folsomia candida TaxID=158441 RepID=UPI000B8F91B7|nr:calcium-activated chloride channel regulator 2 [Folsomia candida]XP_021963354.1 calcium-activated chloride channel regulator 2 [Folsomia candida]XP_035707041.1 calcium-activated chloride channel regulator 2 [Folsomia candida]XP_035707043.1 calcium-activated chloride channel regulator 2 [Folsomia candida]